MTRDEAFEIDGQLGSLNLIMSRVYFLSKTLMVFDDNHSMPDYDHEDLTGLGDILCHVACDLRDVHKGLSPFADFKEKEAPPV